MAEDEKTTSKTRPEHPQGGRVTRDDPADLGVPMLQAILRSRRAPKMRWEPARSAATTPERVGNSLYHPHTSEVIPADEREEGRPDVSAWSPSGPALRKLAMRRA